MPNRSLHRYTAFGYGWIAYLVALASVAYAVGFLANVVPKSVDSGATHSLGNPLVVNVALIGLFGLQHSLMARPGFKAVWTRFVPEPVERSTYVLLASLALVVLMWGWRPLPAVVWRVDGVPEPLLWAVYLGGWLLMFAAIYMIDKDDLMGLRQVRAYRAEREPEPIDFQTPYLYRYVRHPLVTGFVVAFWATSRMTVGHLVFAVGMTGYILVGVKLEERDLVATFGDRYRRYQAEVPMFVPRPGRAVSPSPDETDDG
ncbi:methanethiol S-methyltransferase [Haladaptatus halobius]|uniref:methanethiol S-methyltransferase n=1 Tax=Haladaptatus halobius TaxID=2884875 RepID=UPI001D0B2E29|nr:methanethiol S-methyltransferase [Haladaptatus halobius]